MGSVTMNPPAPTGRAVDLYSLTMRGDLDVPAARAAILEAIEEARRRAYLVGPYGWAGLAAAIVNAWADDLEGAIPPRRMSHAKAAALGRRAIALARLAAALPAPSARRWAA